MKTWITADWHLGEDRFELMGRPFETQLGMVEQLSLNHNRRVNPEDDVIMVGDVCYQKTPKFLEFVKQFNGRKTLIRGNHDRVFTDDELKPYFHTIVPEGAGIEMTIEGIPCYITHYPTQGRPDRFNLVGHIHAAWKYQLNMLNIGVDVHHFRPVDLSIIPFHVNAVTKFYDDDVWAAYNGINDSYIGVRGKLGSYFQPNA